MYCKSGPQLLGVVVSWSTLSPLFLVLWTYVSKYTPVLGCFDAMQCFLLTGSCKPPRLVSAFQDFMSCDIESKVMQCPLPDDGTRNSTIAIVHGG